jgi:hypothetical protein
MPAEILHHERTLLGALDSYLSALVRVRPHLVGAYRDVLERMAGVWLRRDGANDVGAIPPAWLRLHVFEAGDRVSQAAIDDFVAWAAREGLIEREAARAYADGPAA